MFRINVCSHTCTELNWTVGEDITAKKLVEEVIKKEPGDIKQEPQGASH